MRPGRELFVTDWKRSGTWVALMILLLTMALVYGKVRTFDYIDYRDGLYVRDNVHVSFGVTTDALAWAFSPDSARGAQYHPLAWVSHMTDAHLFGMAPGGHHLLNAAFHLGNTVLLFLLLWKATGARWRSLLTAAMFGLHPAGVEAVAWVAERKTLLGAFFFLLTLLSYRFYARKPGVPRYTLVLAFFVCGLLSHPIVAVLPFVLLLLDLWPLDRLRTPGEASSRVKGGRLALEKAPLLALAVLSAGASILSLGWQPQTGASGPVPLDLRLAQAAVAYVTYLAKLVAPVNLAIFHPYPDAVPIWQAAGSVLLIAGSFTAACFLKKRHPFVLVGLLWYTAAIVPALGIVQAGSWPAYAERWAYVPFMGMFIVLGWGLPLVLERLRIHKDASAAIPLVVLAFWGGLAWIQTGYWKDSLILFSHAADSAPKSDFVENRLGAAYGVLGFSDQALEHYRVALAINPLSARAHAGVARELALRGTCTEAMEHIDIALKLRPGNADVYLARGDVLERLDRLDEAVESYRHASRMDPRMAPAWYGLGKACARANRLDEAENGFRAAIRIRPTYAEAHLGLGNALQSMGRIADARKSYEDALKVRPGYLAAKVRLKMLASVEKSGALGNK